MLKTTKFYVYVLFPVVDFDETYQRQLLCEF
jgi:hypothetical protein